MLYVLTAAAFAEDHCENDEHLPPTATTDPATNITDNSAALNATVNPNGSETTAYFEWGTDTSYGNSTPPQSVTDGGEHCKGNDITITADITGLSPATTYHYRVVANNEHGTTYGNDISLTTTGTLFAEVTGTVTDSSTSLPLSEVTVTITDSLNNIHTGTTDENGEYTITDLPYGDFTGTFTKSGYIGQTLNGALVAGQTLTLDVQLTPIPPLTITITSPLDNDTINRSDVMVKGTVTNTTGNETGVTVNGIVAVLYNGEFFVNHVQLEEGQNTITADATDTEGNTATTSITVNAVTTEPYVTLRANIESGIAPLTTYFSVSTSIPNAVANYEIDYEGDGVIDYTGAAFEDISVTYSTEGVYYPTITVTDDQSNTYTDTIAIVVLNQTELDTLLRSKWEAMKTALSAQDVDGALVYFTEESKDSYNEIFTALYDQLPQLIQDMQDIQLIYSEGNMAKYRIRKSELYGGQTYEITYYTYFAVDIDGIWRIHKF